MNSHIGEDENYKFDLHTFPNRNGEYEADFSFDNSLSCLNSKFTKKDRVNYEPSNFYINYYLSIAFDVFTNRKLTSFSVDEILLQNYGNWDNPKSQLDDILISKNWINSTINFEAYSSFEAVSYDPRNVSTKKRLGLRRNKKETFRTKRVDWYWLTNSNKSNQYTIIVRNKSDTLLNSSEIHNPKEEYEKSITTTWKQ